MHCVVEVLNDLLRGLELLEVRGEVHFILFQVNEVLVCLPHSFNWIFAPPVIKVGVP